MTATEGLARSIHTRLVAKAKALGIEAQLLLERYALHRLLFRLSQSSHVERFLLKGAQLMLIWIGETARATRDADLLGFGDLSDNQLLQILEDLCTQSVADDGMEYLVETIQIAPIREENAYGGYRIHLWSQLGAARLRIPIDIGIGDAVTPEPEWVELPQILDLPAPKLQAYRPETSIAEKLETIVARGLLNSRLKDYFDIYVLSKNEAFESRALSAAIRDTFERRGTALPSALPVGLTMRFADEAGKRLQWRGFVSKTGVSDIPEDLGEIIEGIVRFLGPVTGEISKGDESETYWPPGGPWRSKNV